MDHEQETALQVHGEGTGHFEIVPESTTYKRPTIIDRVGVWRSVDENGALRPTYLTDIDPTYAASGRE